MRRSTDGSESSGATVELLSAKLEASEAKLEVQQLRTEVERLQSVVAKYQEELRESHRLLLKQRLPRRPFTSSTERMLIAAGQGWICAGYDDCPLRMLNSPPGRFDKSLWVIEHLEPWAATGRHLNNRAAWCHWCASVKTRREVAEGLHKPLSDSESESAENEDT